MSITKQGKFIMILILDPSSAPAQIHVSSSDQLMQRLSQLSRFNNKRVVAIAGFIRLCTLSSCSPANEQIEASTRN